MSEMESRFGSRCSLNEVKGKYDASMISITGR